MIEILKIYHISAEPFEEVEKKHLIFLLFDEIRVPAICLFHLLFKRP